MDVTRMRWELMIEKEHLVDQKLVVRGESGLGSRLKRHEETRLQIDIESKVLAWECKANEKAQW